MSARSRLWQWILWGGIILALLAGCVPGKEEEQAIELSFYSNAWLPEWRDLEQELVEEFNQAHAGKVQLTYVEGNWGAAEAYVRERVHQGRPIADLVNWYTDGGAWYQEGLCQDLRPYLEMTDFQLASTTLWHQAEAEDGAIYLIPWFDMSPPVVFYRTDAFHQAGILPPAPGRRWTWKEFEQVARQLTIDAQGHNLLDHAAEFDPKQVQQWGFAPRLGLDALWTWGQQIALQTSGAYLVREENGTLTFTLDEAQRSALDLFYGAVQQKIAPPASIGLSVEGQYELLGTGQVAMVFGDLADAAWIRHYYPELEFGVSALPAGAPTAPIYLSPGTGGVVVPATSAHPSEAVDAALWFLQPEINARMAYTYTIPPANPTAYTFPPLAGDPLWVTVRGMVQLGNPAPSPPEDERISWFRTAIYIPAIDDLVHGRRTFQETMETLEREASELFASPEQNP